MSGGWPSSIDPVQLAENGARLTGELSLAAMPRLSQSCCDPAGSVSVDLQFERSDSEGLRIMRGTVRASMRVTCQRCLEEMALDLQIEPNLILLRPGEREDLEREDEALVVERPLALSALVEDELLLAMPMIPMHAPAVCPARRPLEHAPVGGRRQRPNPFAALRRLKRDHP